MLCHFRHCDHTLRNVISYIWSILHRTWLAVKQWEIKWRADAIHTGHRAPKRVSIHMLVTTSIVLYKYVNWKRKNTKRKCHSITDAVWAQGEPEVGSLNSIAITNRRCLINKYESGLFAVVLFFSLFGFCSGRATVWTSYEPVNPRRGRYWTWDSGHAIFKLFEKFANCWRKTNEWLEKPFVQINVKRMNVVGIWSIYQTKVMGSLESQ